MISDIHRQSLGHTLTLGLMATGLTLVLFLESGAIFESHPGILLAIPVLFLVGIASGFFTTPTLPLLLALVFLTSPAALVLDNEASAIVTGFLLMVSILGTAFSSSQRTESKSDSLVRPVWVLGGYALLSALYGFLHGNPKVYVAGDLFQVLEFAAVYILVSRLVTDEKSLFRFFFWLSVSSILTILFELGVFLLNTVGISGMSSWEGDAVSGTLVRTIDLNAIIVFAVLLNLHALLGSGKHRRLIYILLIPTVANVALSLTRGIWVGSLVAMLVSATLVKGKKMRLLRPLAAAAVCLAVLAVLKVGSGSGGTLLDVFQERIRYGVTQVEEGSEGAASLATRRFLEVTTIAPQLSSSLVNGRGLGATYVIEGVAVMDSQALGFIDNHYIHNLYLLVAYRMGLVGLLLFCWILVRYFRSSWSAHASTPESFNRSVMAGFMAGMAGQAVLSITSPTILNHPTCGVIAGVMALTFKLRKLESVNPGSPSESTASA